MHGKVFYIELFPKNDTLIVIFYLDNYVKYFLSTFFFLLEMLLRNVRFVITLMN